MNLRVWCSILKRIVILLDSFVLLAMGSGIYFIGAKELANTLLLFLLSIICFWVSYELGYIVQHLIIRLELNRKGGKRCL